MRVLLLILQFPPDVNSNGLLMAQIGEGLTRRGHTVSVITTFPHYERFRVWKEYRGKLARRQCYRGMRVLRLYIYARGAKQRMTHRFMSYFSFSVLATLAGLCDRQTYDVLLCPNGGFLTGIAAAVIGAIKHVPVILNLQDLYPETPIQTGQVRAPWLIKTLRALEHWMYARATHVSVITPRFFEYLLGLGVPEKKVSVIPNFVDTTFIRPLPKDNAFARRLSLANRFVVSHAGNLGLAYDLETLLEAAQLLAGYADIQFLIVGDGILKRALEDHARRLGLANLQFLPYQPQAELPLLRAASDIQLALTGKGASMHSMPSKVYEIMASGRPLLASADRHSDLWQLVNEVQCGLCVEPGDAPALAKAVVSLYQDPFTRQAMGERGRAEAEQRYSQSAVVESYDRLVRRVAEEASISRQRSVLGRT